MAGTVHAFATVPAVTASASIPEFAGANDGRRARRDRNRDAVVAATIELLLERNGIPLLHEIAERAGVSLRSLHRYFEEADAVVAEAHLTYLEQHPTTTAAVPVSLLRAPLPERVAWRVDVRIDECRASNRAFLALTARANRSPLLRAAVETTRRAQIDVVAHLFAPELARFDEPERTARRALAHTATMSETWDNLTRRHGLDDEHVRTAWTRTLHAALAPHPAAP
jgi:TetR/AcrR family transcriptional regulator, regulator of autoinduction and epiphytic fitness